MWDCLCSAGVSTSDELDPSQNLVEEFFLRRVLRHLPTTIRPLLLSDLGFGRASLIRFLQKDARPHRLPSGLRDPHQGQCGSPECRLSRSVAGLSPP